MESDDVLESAYTNFFTEEVPVEGTSDDFLDLNTPEILEEPKDTVPQELLDLQKDPAGGVTAVIDGPTPTSNQIAASVKRAFLESGGDMFWLRLAKSNPNRFADVVTKVLPRNPDDDFPTEFHLSFNNYVEKSDTPTEAEDAEFTDVVASDAPLENVFYKHE